MSTEPEPEPSLLDWTDLHVLYLSILTIAMGFSMVGAFASRAEPADQKIGLVAAAIAFCIGAPGALFATRVIDRQRFQPGERSKYTLVNGAVLVVGAALLLGRAWATWL